MSDDFEKTKKDYSKRNKYAAMLRDQGDWKGAFSLKVADSRKTDYKRTKMRTNEVYDEEE